MNWNKICSLHIVTRSGFGRYNNIRNTTLWQRCLDVVWLRDLKISKNQLWHKAVCQWGYFSAVFLENEKRKLVLRYTLQKQSTSKVVQNLSRNSYLKHKQHYKRKWVNSCVVKWAEFKTFAKVFDVFTKIIIFFDKINFVSVKISSEPWSF